MAYNDFLDEIVLFGGAIQQVPGASVLVNDTWFFRPGIGWGQCGTIPGHPCGTPPVSRCCVGLGFADAGGRTVLFGGGTAGLYQYNDTWTWDVASGWVCRSMQNCNMPG